jgi:nucleotide-binding universal stress UspA family protein
MFSSESRDCYNVDDSDSKEAVMNAILVPLDGSSFSEHALPIALGVAQRAGAMLALAHVHTTPVHYGIEGLAVIDTETDDINRTAEQAYLDGIVLRLSGTLPRPVTARLLDGPVADALQDYAAAINADLIVMTTHGRGLFSRMWLGSVADALVRQSTVPIILVRPKPDETQPIPVPSPVTFHHILVPLDGSPLAERMLARAAHFAAIMGAKLTLLMAVELSLTRYVAGVEDEILATATHEARTYLDRMAAPLRAQGLSVETFVSVEPPAAAILDYAATHDCDLIAMETHGHGGISRLLLGSVTDKVVRAAHIPILVHCSHQSDTKQSGRAEHTAAPAR